jgi:hypothetical protein
MGKASPINDPKHLRMRASELRGLADQMHDDQAKQRILLLAEEYDKFAANAERLRSSQAEDQAKSR